MANGLTSLNGCSLQRAPADPRFTDLIFGSHLGSPLPWQNITLTLGLKAIFLVMAIFGSASMWMAVFADMGASLLMVFNGLRLMRNKL